jgi:hypothetical protein
MLAVVNWSMLSNAGLCLLTLTERIERKRFSGIEGGTCGMRGNLFVVENLGDLLEIFTFLNELKETRVSDMVSSHLRGDVVG